MITSSKYSQKAQEKRLGKLSGGKRQPLSGASMYAKGDVSSPLFLGEAKQTANLSLSIKQQWLKKIDEEAMAVDKIPFLAIEFLNMPKMSSKDWVMVPDYIFKDFIEYLNSKEH